MLYITFYNANLCPLKLSTLGFSTGWEFSSAASLLISPEDQRQRAGMMSV
jgi:hypothetical protein